MELTLQVFKRIGNVIFVFFLLFFAIRILQYHFHLISFPYPVSLREGSMMTNTDALVKGLNPYDMALQPRYTNQYGIIYPLLAWPWAKLFGTTIIVHRMLTAFFLFASCVLIFLVLNRMKTPLLLNIWTILMLYASWLYPGTSTPTIDPGSTAMFFFLATIFIPWLCRYSYPSLIVSVLFGILAYYTKPYTMLGIAVMASYIFLFVSRKKGFIYGALYLILAVISILFVNRTCQSYFDNCFFALSNMSHAWSTMERLQWQTGLYTGLHKWTLILIGAYILGYSWIRIRTLKTAGIRTKFHVPLVLYAGLCAAFVLYISLGRHNGATLWYFFQLLSPFFLIAAVWLFSRTTLWPILCVPFLVLNLYALTADLDHKWFNKDSFGWPDVSVLVSSHQHILNSSLIAPLLVEQNKDVYDNGQAEYFLPGGDRHSWMVHLSKEDPRVIVQHMLFFQNIRNMVENKQFDLIMLQPSLLPMGVADDVKKFYKYEGQLIVYAIQDRKPYAISVWLPLK